MVFNRLFRGVRDLFGYCGIGFLVVCGIETAFAYPGMMIGVQRRWVGYWMLASALAVTSRFNALLRDKRQQPLAK